MRKIKAMIEAAIFMAHEPVSVDKLKKLLKIKPEKIRFFIEELKKDYSDEDHGFYILEAPTGFQFKIKAEYTGYVRTLTPYKDLSRGLLKTLALIAYKQPITQSQVVKVLGNRTYNYVKKLEQKGLVRTVKHGRTKALIATKEFANYFGLESTKDLKKLFEGIKNEKD